ncbi:MAG: Patatin [Myxococcales bacterium]|nr:Patatin [Myxococcales bacterium]
MATDAPRTAVVLSGGVAKGAFEAGALDVLIERGIRPSIVIGTSSGSLNATMLAGAVRAGRERDATRRLLTLWRDDADWMHIFHLTLRDALDGRGLSDSARIVELMRRELPAITTSALHHVRLRIVVAVLQGVRHQISRQTATTFEGVLAFEDGDFDDDSGRERIYNAAAASAAFPVLFNPVEVPGLGPCYDGGVVNDVPVKLAADGGADRVIILAPYPAELDADKVPRGVELAARLVDVLIHERLYRDLQEAERVNLVIARIHALATDGVLDDEQVTQVLKAFDARPLEIITIRPARELPGNAFAGFLHRNLREQYMTAGHDMANLVLDDLAKRDS